MGKTWSDAMWPMDENYVPAALGSAAIDAYIYGYPLVLVEMTKRAMLASGSKINCFTNERAFPDPRYTTIVRPNVDTLYSMAWLDLSAEPVILSVPDTHGRYYVLEFLDAWTNVFASVGARTTGTRERTFLITGPGWNGVLPDGMSRIETPGDRVWIIGRTQTNGLPDFPAVHAIQDQYGLTPLSRWGNVAGQIARDWQPAAINETPVSQVANMTAAGFFQAMTQAMDSNPPWIADPAMADTLAALGLVPAKAFDFFRLNPAVRQSLEFAAAHGLGRIQAEAVEKYLQNSSNGWSLMRQNIGFYGADYLQRAVVALVGIGANLPQDAVYGTAFTDEAGGRLAGRYNYILHFDKDRLPPARAFWSITAYNDQGYLIPNPIRRYALSPHLGNLNFNRDGSLDIFVGMASPGKNSAANWLPVSAGRFNLAIRLYWPSRSVLEGRWNPPGVARV
ncbi:MAG: DUF1254 domain-containing protein [Negativicutes bacterium]|nr:DUF1254 domain-containing protein [Negativicutes bacterium]